MAEGKKVVDVKVLTTLAGSPANDMLDSGLMPKNAAKSAPDGGMLFKAFANKGGNPAFIPVVYNAPGKS